MLDLLESYRELKKEGFCFGKKASQKSRLLHQVEMSDCSLCWFLTLSHVCSALLSQKIRSASTKANLEFIDFCVLGVCVYARVREYTSLSSGLTWTCESTVLPGGSCTNLPVYREKKCQSKETGLITSLFSGGDFTDGFLLFLTYKILLQTDGFPLVSAVPNIICRLNTIRLNRCSFKGT